MPRTLAPLAPLAVLLATLTFAPEVSAQTPSGRACGDATVDWVARCNAVRRADISRVECPAPGLFLFTTPDARVEVQRNAARSFRQVNGWGLSLIHENASWESLSAAKRTAFERVQACVTADGSLPLAGPSTIAFRTQRGTGDRTGDRTGDDHLDHSGTAGNDRTGDDHLDHSGTAGNDRTGDNHLDRSGTAGNDRTGERRHGGGGEGGARWILPWRLLLAAGLLLAAWWPRRHRALAQLPRRVGAVVGAALAIALTRWWVYRPGFFHQNGQGPMWIDSALSAWLPYGPGFSEIFNLPARLYPAAPDLAVFAAQGFLSGLSLVAAWALAARCIPATPSAPVLAAAAVSVLLVHPAVGRVSVTESYLATGLSLELIAAWALSHGHLPRGDGRAKFRALAPTLAGGFVLSLAVGVHPVGWMPAAGVPLVMLATPGSLRRRLKRVFLSYAIVGAVVLVTALPGVVSVLRSELLQRLGHRPPFDVRTLRPVFTLVGLIALVSLVFGRRRRHTLVRLLPLIPLGIVGPATDAITASGAREYIASAFLWMEAPVALALSVAALGSVPRRSSHTWGLALLIALGGLGWSAKHFRAQTLQPADALEQRAWMRWRDRLPPGAAVAWLSRAENHILALPLYPATDPRSRQTAPVTALDERIPLLPGDRSYWYHATSCSSPEGRAACERLERRLRLEPVFTTTLPGRWSLAHVGFDRASLPVGLYRIRGVR